MGPSRLSPESFPDLLVGDSVGESVGDSVGDCRRRKGERKQHMSAILSIINMKTISFEPYQCWRRRGIQGRSSGWLARWAGAQVPFPDLANLGFSRAVKLSRYLDRRGGTCQHYRNRKYTVEFHCVLLCRWNRGCELGGVRGEIMISSEVWKWVTLDSTNNRECGSTKKKLSLRCAKCVE